MAVVYRSIHAPHRVLHIMIAQMEQFVVEQMSNVLSKVRICNLRYQTLNVKGG